MMKPYPKQNLFVDKKVYNCHHSRGRRISEKLFGILANRWTIYFTTIPLEPERVEFLIISTLALYNMLSKSAYSRNAYRPIGLADSIGEGNNVIKSKIYHQGHLQGLFYE